MKRPLFLVTNDDGVAAEGIHALAEGIAAVGEVVVVAPDRERSAAGHSLTLQHPLRATELSANRYVVDGTPTDCVNWGTHYLLRGRRPDAILSGINFGLNLGDDVTYSGTVSAAFEGAILGIPSIAFSQEIAPGFTFDAAAAFARDLAVEVLRNPLRPGTLLNVNVPAGDVRGVRAVKMGRRVYQEGVVEKLDPRGRKYYWIGASPPTGEPEEGTDLWAIAEKLISVTPLHLDLTDYSALEALDAAVARFSAVGRA
ncbi:MAG TPA: 5'/3'-nucleotidase SurE [Thermoanaerobaculia bacterium]|nr:5'/3'-nucleotidase SurE [Thermoanaerobaculia bacterium]